PSHGSSRPLPSVLPEALSRVGRCVASGSVCRPLAGSHLTCPFGLHHPPGSCRVVHPTHVSGLSARASRPVSTGLWLPLALRRVAFASWVILCPLRRGPPFRRSAGLLARGARPQRGCRVPHPERCDGGGRLLYCGA